MAACAAMFHVQLRRFPHVAYVFNLSEADLHARVLEPWSAGRTIELGERRWLPEQTRLFILEGPELAPHDLALGRGWARAQRHGRDVTAQLLARPVAPAATAGDRALADELLARAAAGPLSLADVWRLVHEARPQWAASDCLAAAERALSLLVAENLARVERAPGPDAAPDDAGALLREPESWAGGATGAVLVHPDDSAAPSEPASGAPGGS